MSGIRAPASRLAAAIFLAAALLVTLIILAREPQALSLLPLLGLGLLHLVRRYPGERVIAALRAGRATPARAPRRIASPRPVARVLPRGGRLIASALAVRPPPAFPAAR